MRPTDSVHMSIKSNATSTEGRLRRPRIESRPRRGHLVLCLRTDGYEASLEPRKIYLALPDRDAAKHEQVRVIDESGEDYLFPSSLFVSIQVPATLRRALLAAL